MKKRNKERQRKVKKRGNSRRKEEKERRKKTEERGIRQGKRKKQKRDAESAVKQERGVILFKVLQDH